MSDDEEIDDDALLNESLLQNFLYPHVPDTHKRFGTATSTVSETHNRLAALETRQLMQEPIHNLSTGVNPTQVPEQALTTPPPQEIWGTIVAATFLAGKCYKCNVEPVAVDIQSSTDRTKKCFYCVDCAYTLGIRVAAKELATATLAGRHGDLKKLEAHTAITASTEGIHARTDMLVKEQLDARKSRNNPQQGISAHLDTGEASATVINPQQGSGQEENEHHDFEKNDDDNGTALSEDETTTEDNVDALANSEKGTPAPARGRAAQQQQAARLQPQSEVAPGEKGTSQMVNKESLRSQQPHTNRTSNPLKLPTQTQGKRSTTSRDSPESKRQRTIDASQAPDGGTSQAPDGGTQPVGLTPLTEEENKLTKIYVASVAEQLRPATKRNDEDEEVSVAISHPRVHSIAVAQASLLELWKEEKDHNKRNDYLNHFIKKILLLGYFTEFFTTIETKARRQSMMAKKRGFFEYLQSLVTLTPAELAQIPPPTLFSFKQINEDPAHTLVPVIDEGIDNMMRSNLHCQSIYTNQYTYHNSTLCGVAPIDPFRYNPLERRVGLVPDHKLFSLGKTALNVGPNAETSEFQACYVVTENIILVPLKVGHTLQLMDENTSEWSSYVILDFQNNRVQVGLDHYIDIRKLYESRLRIAGEDGNVDFFDNEKDISKMFVAKRHPDKSARLIEELSNKIRTEVDNASLGEAELQEASLRSKNASECLAEVVRKLREEPHQDEDPHWRAICELPTKGAPTEAMPGEVKVDEKKTSIACMCCGKAIKYSQKTSKPTFKYTEYHKVTEEMLTGNKTLQFRLEAHAREEKHAPVWANHRATVHRIADCLVSGTILAQERLRSLVQRVFNEEGIPISAFIDLAAGRADAFKACVYELLGAAKVTKIGWEEKKKKNNAKEIYSEFFEEAYKGPMNQSNKPPKKKSKKKPAANAKENPPATENLGAAMFRLVVADVLDKAVQEFIMAFLRLLLQTDFLFATFDVGGRPKHLAYRLHSIVNGLFASGLFWQDICPLLEPLKNETGGFALDKLDLTSLAAEFFVGEGRNPDSQYSQDLRKKFKSSDLSKDRLKQFQASDIGVDESMKKMLKPPYTLHDEKIRCLREYRAARESGEIFDRSKWKIRSPTFGYPNQKPGGTSGWYL